MFLLNKQHLSMDTPFTAGEGASALQYPANWLRNSTKAERDAIGITEIATTLRPDDRYYYVSENTDGSFDSVEKPLYSLKCSAVELARSQAKSKLSSTDWQVIRLLERGVPIAPVISDYRKAVLEAFADYENLVTKVVHVSSFSALSPDWPTLP